MIIYIYTHAVHSLYKYLYPTFLRHLALRESVICKEMAFSSITSSIFSAHSRLSAHVSTTCYNAYTSWFQELLLIVNIVSSLHVTVAPLVCGENVTIVIELVEAQTTLVTYYCEEYTYKAINNV